MYTDVHVINIYTFLYCKKRNVRMYPISIYVSTQILILPATAFSRRVHTGFPGSCSGSSFISGCSRCMILSGRFSERSMTCTQNTLPHSFDMRPVCLHFAEVFHHIIIN